MRAVARFANSSILAVLSGRIPGQLQKTGILVGLRGVLIASLLGTCGAAMAQAKTATTTTLAVASGGSVVTTVASGSAVTLTAQVNAGASALTTGQVKFCDATAAYCTDIHVLGTAQLTTTGTAILKLRPGIGSHSYNAVFAGTNTYAGSSSGPSALTVTGKYPTTTAITESGSPGDYTLTATVAAADSAPNAASPTGTVSFLDTSFGNSVIATASLESGTPQLSFFNSQTPSAGADPQSVAIGDFNGDGIPDIAVANYGGTVTILLGNGDGTFTQATNSPITLNNTTFAVAVGDFNRDGKADLAVLSGYYNGTVTIFLGNGDGAFTQSTANPLSVGGTYGINDAAAVGDFNGDGILDLAIASDGYAYQPSTVTVLLGNGDGTFTPVNGTPVTVGEAPISVAVGDFNGDGIADFATVGFYGASVSIFLGNGDGTFTQAPNSPVTVGSFPYAISVADFNRDGKIDLAVANSAYTSGSPGTVTILLGNGNGTFTQAPDSPVTVGSTPQSAAVGDFNGDGIPDLAVANDGNDTLTILLGNGNGTFTQAPNSPVSVGDFPQSTAVADFTGAGLSDLAVGNQNDSVSVLLSEFETATATVSSVAPVGASTHLVEASYAGDSNYGPSVSGTASLAAGVATPVITPASGNITSAQSITMTDATPGATIYYYAYGAINTSGYVPYTAPIPLEGDGTINIQAYATETGYQQSQSVSATYTLNFSSAAATPVLSVGSGLYPSAQTLTISDTTPGAQIYYTTNGLYPSASANLYNGPITVSSSEIVSAVALAPGLSASGIATAQYDIATSSTRFIYTIAGNYTYGYTGDDGPATFAELANIQGVAVDTAGNVYLADSANNVVREVAAGTGIITTIAGTGTAGHTGDNGPATSAELWNPSSLAVDANGNLYIGETGDNVVRLFNAGTGTITTFAGNPSGTGSFGGPATSFSLVGIGGIALNSLGTTLYIANDFNVVEVNTGNGVISLPTGLTSYPGFGYLTGITVDRASNIYVSDEAYSVVREISPTGTVTVFAGSLNGGFGGDGGPATSARLDYPAGLATDSAGNIYIADNWDYAIREVNTSGIINTIAGILNEPYEYGEGADGSPATAVGLSYPQAIASDAAGNIYLSDQATYRIRKITVPTTPPGTAAAVPALSLSSGTYFSPQTLSITDSTPGVEVYVSLNGTAPTTASQGYHGPIDITGTVAVQAIALAPGYQASGPVTATYTFPTPPTAVISTVAGTGVYGYSGVGGLAINTKLGQPEAVAFDSAGDLYIVDGRNNVVWMVAASTGNITVVAGNGTYGYAGDGGPATAAELADPAGVVVDKLGNLYIADMFNSRVRMVSAQTGVITTVAGPGLNSVLGDGGPATSAFVVPSGMAFDSAENLYIADSTNSRIRKIAAATGIISTVAGGGTAGQLGDGGLATAATLSHPYDVKLDAFGNLYISDSYNGRIRKVDASTGLISTIAGNGILGDSGDGDLATAAEIYVTGGVALDATGNVYISNWTDAVRKVDATTGVITTIAGNGYFGFSGDGGAASEAGLNYPQGLAFDGAGNLYIADADNSAVRKVTFPGPAPAPTFSLAAGNYVGAHTVTINDSIQAAAIYYTTDGTTPTEASNLYGGVITVSVSETLQAIAVATGYTESAVTSAAYTINQPVTPTITWATPAAITYGTRLSATQLDATSSVAGTFAYTPAIGTLLTAGSQKLSVTFTPTDAVDYTTATASVTLTVNQATPTITWAAPAAITYGTPLSGMQLDATSTVAGTFAYTPAIGTVLTAGSQKLSVTFTPIDTTDDTTATATVTLTVSKAAPTVTETPSATSITTAQPLTVTIAVNAGSSSQAPTGSITLSGGGYTSAATALSNGGATINIPAGSLTVGSDALTVTYTPDAAGAGNYTSATQSATVAVAPAIGSAIATVSVTPNATTITNNQSLTVQIAVTGAGGQATPTGAVTLTSGSYSSQQPLSGGTASFSVAAGSLSSGADTLTATYSGDPTYAISSGTANVTVSPVTIAIPAISTISPGNSITATATFTAGTNYSGTMNLACTLTSSPTGAQSLPTCSLSPTSVTLSSAGNGNTKLTINTTLASPTSLAVTHKQNLLGLGEGGALLAGAFIFFLPSRRRRWISMLALMLVLAGAGAIGCGGSSKMQPSGPGTPSTTAGNYTFTVTGTDSVNSNITVSTTATVTVQ